MMGVTVHGQTELGSMSQSLQDSIDVAPESQKGSDARQSNETVS